MNQDVRLLKHDSSIVRKDHLDTHWEETTGEKVDEVIFLSKHTAASNRPALTVHPIGRKWFLLVYGLFSLYLWRTQFLLLVLG